MLNKHYIYANGRKILIYTYRKKKNNKPKDMYHNIDNNVSRKIGAQEVYESVTKSWMSTTYCQPGYTVYRSMNKIGAQEVYDSTTKSRASTTYYQPGYTVYRSMNKIGAQEVYDSTTKSRASTTYYQRDYTVYPSKNDGTEKNQNSIDTIKIVSSSLRSPVALLHEIDQTRYLWCCTQAF